VPDGTPVWLVLDHPAGTGTPGANPGLVPGRTSALYRRFGPDEIHHVSVGDQTDLARVGRLAVGRGVALVLSGGGARGFAHIGVMRSLDEAGVPVDRFIGASMGAIVASGLAQGFDHAGRVEVALRYFQNLFDYTIPVVSVLRGRRITNSIQAYTDGRNVEDLWAPFACVATDLTTAEVVPFRRGPLDLAIRASTAIPGLLPPVPHHGNLLVDGGVLNNLPIDLATDDPSVGTVIAVDVAPPRGPGARSDYGHSVSGLSALWSTVGPGKTNYPALSPVLMRTMLIASARDRDAAIRAGAADLYLDLDLRGVSLLEFDRIEEVADRGYQASKDRVAAWTADHTFSGVNGVSR
jgi:predicted acylesterase/phospholipase RssA